MSLYSIIREMEEFRNESEDNQMKQFREVGKSGDYLKLEGLTKELLSNLHSYQMTEDIDKPLTSTQVEEIFRKFIKNYLFTPECSYLEIAGSSIKWKGTKSTGIHLTTFKELLLLSLQSDDALQMYYISEEERNYALKFLAEMTPHEYNKLLYPVLHRKPDNCVSCVYKGLQGNFNEGTGKTDYLFKPGKSRGIVGVIPNALCLDLIANEDTYGIVYDYWKTQRVWLIQQTQK